MPIDHQPVNSKLWFLILGNQQNEIQTPAEPVSSRVEALDGLRGLGALIVVLWHIAVSFLPSAAFGVAVPEASRWQLWLFSSPLWVMLSGSFAVSVFFVMSGYVLTIGHFRRPELTTTVRRMLARWPRLAMPAAAGTLAMFLFLLATPGFRDDVLLPVLTKTGSYALHQTGIGTMPLTMHGLLDNLFWRPWFLTPDFGKIYNGVLWTMYIELSGSFIAMTLSIVGATMAWRLNSILLVGLVAAVLLFAAPPGYGIYFALFLAGTAIAAIDPPIRVRQGRARTLMLGLFFLGLLLGGYNGTGLSAAFSFLFVQSNIIPGGVLIMGVGAVLVFWTVLTDETVAGWFRARPMRYLGRVSFALYLFHVIVILAIGVPAFALLPDNWPVELRGLAASAIVLVLAIALSEIMTRAVDEPSVAFSRRLARLFVP